MQIDKKNEILDVGCGSGYSSIIFGKFFKFIVSVEEDITLVKIFHEYLKTNKITNCQVLNTKFNEIKLEKKFDHIFINGAIDQFPFYLTKYLKKMEKFIPYILKMIFHHIFVNLHSKTMTNMRRLNYLKLLRHYYIISNQIK